MHCCGSIDCDRSTWNLVEGYAMCRAGIARVARCRDRYRLCPQERFLYNGLDKLDLGVRQTGCEDVESRT